MLGERLTPTSELSESCRDLAGGWRLQPLPQPVLQRVEADEHGIRGQQQMLIAAVLRALPGELHRVDEDQPRRLSGRGCCRSVTRFGGEADDVRERRRRGA